MKSCAEVTKTGPQASKMMKCLKGKKDEADVQKETDAEPRWPQRAKGGASTLCVQVLQPHPPLAL